MLLNMEQCDALLHVLQWRGRIHVDVNLAVRFLGTKMLLAVPNINSELGCWVFQVQGFAAVQAQGVSNVLIMLSILQFVTGLLFLGTSTLFLPSSSFFQHRIFSTSLSLPHPSHCVSVHLSMNAPMIEQQSPLMVRCLVCHVSGLMKPVSPM